MEELIKMITDKTGISADQAQTAIKTVSGFLKDKLPGGLGNQVENFLEKGSIDTENIMNDLKGSLGNLFGN
ncbi:MAG: hypothetical protein H6605_04525 [Flavobacteriales bacterium]|nr:hypothetical protein [Flavobacteriales bacterium]